MKTLAFYAVWGDKYIERFLKYALPTQMSSGNLFALQAGSAIKIATRVSDVERFNKSPAIAECRRRLNLEILPFSDLMFERKGDDKYSVLLELQNRALRLSRDFDAIIFGYADALWAEGSYENAIKRLEAGYDVVMCVGFNVVESAVTDLLDREYEKPTGRSIAPRRFARMVYDNLHVVARSRFWDYPHMNNYPSFLLWNVRNKGIIARVFHLHPVIIRVRHEDPAFFSPFNVTLDEGLVPRLITMGAVPYVSLCSDEMSVCGLLDEVIESHMYLSPLRPPNISDVVVFAERSTTLHHREFFQQPVRLVLDDNSDNDDWDRAEAEAQRVCNEITHRLFLPDEIVKHETPLAFAARRERLFRHRDSNRVSFFLTEDYVKNTDTSVLAEILTGYLDRRGARLFSFFSMGAKWPRFRRAVRSLFRRRGNVAHAVVQQQEQVHTRTSLNIDYVLAFINLRGILLIAYELVVRRRRF